VAALGDGRAHDFYARATTPGHHLPPGKDMLRSAFYLGLLALGVTWALRAPFIGAIACVAAYLLNPSVITGAEERYQLFTTGALILSCLIHQPTGTRPVGNEGLLLYFLWAFVAFGALTSTWAVVSSEDALEAIFEVAKTVLLTSLLVCVIRDERDMTIIILTCIIGAWHAAFAHTFGVRWGFVPSTFQRDIGVLPDPQAGVLALFVPTLCLFVIKGSKYERLLAVGALPFVLNSIISTYERTSFVSLLVQLVLMFIFLPKRILLYALPFVLVAAALFFYRLTPKDYWERMYTIKDPTSEASANSRFYYKQASQKMLADYPMGVGYRNYPVVSPSYMPPELLTEGKRSAHNTYFTVACETGIIGFALFIVPFAGAAWLLRGIRKRTDPKNPTKVELYAMGFELGLYGWFVGGFTQAFHEVDPAYWFVAFAVILTRLQHRAKQEAETAQDTDAGESLCSFPEDLSAPRSQGIEVNTHNQIGSHCDCL
jgi:O-antigen ligase